MYVVTGATGNVGRSLVRALAGSGADVRAVSRNALGDLPAGVTHHRADLADPESLRVASAAPPSGSGPNPVIVWDVNAQTAIWDVARQNDGAFGDQTWVVGTRPGEWRPTPPTFAQEMQRQNG